MGAALVRDADLLVGAAHDGDARLETSAVRGQATVAVSRFFAGGAWSMQSEAPICNPLRQNAAEVRFSPNHSKESGGLPTIYAPGIAC